MWKDKCRRLWYLDGCQHIHISVRNVVKRYKTPTSLNNGNKLKYLPLACKHRAKLHKPKVLPILRKRITNLLEKQFAKHSLVQKRP